MAIRVQGTDGQTFEFPDGMSDADMQSALDAHYGAQKSPAMDVGKAAVGGFERGAVGTLGIPGTIEQGVSALGAAAADRLGVPHFNPVQPLRNAADFAARQTVGRLYNRFAPGGTGDFSADTAAHADAPAPPSLPTAQDVVESYEQARGPTYRGQTTGGQIAGTVGEFLGGAAMTPGAIAPRVVGAVAGGLGSEAAGRAVEGTVAEPYKPLAQVAGGLLAPGLVGRAITPLRTDPARAEAVARLEAQGVTPTAGQRTGSGALRNLESALGETPLGAADPARAQAEQLTAAVGRRMGAEEGALTPDVMRATQERLASNYQQVFARNEFRADPQFGQDLSGVMRKHLDRVTLQQRPEVENAINVMARDIAQGGGRLPGEQYQQMRSWFGERANALKETDAAASRALAETRDALDGAMKRSIKAAGNESDAALLDQTNRQWSGMRAAETAVTRVPQGVPEGQVTPNSIAAAAAQRSSVAQRARGQDELAQLARDARSVLTSPPNSGTAGRLNALHLAGGIGGGALGLLAGSPMAGVGGALAGVAGPAILSNLVNRRAGQAYLGNQLLGQGVLSGAQALVNAQAAGAGLPTMLHGILGPADDRRRLPAR